MVRISMDDHGELDFDESEEEGDFPKRDWKDDSKVESPSKKKEKV